MKTNDRNLLLALSFLFLVPPSVWTQKISMSKPPLPMPIQFGGGFHALHFAAPTGGFAYIACEDKLSPQKTWLARFEAMANPLDFSTPPDVRAPYQIRFLILSEIRHYFRHSPTPSKQRTGFFLSAGLGITGGHGKSPSIYPYVKPRLRIFGELATDIKGGYQVKLTPQYIGGFFIGSGLFIPFATHERGIPVLRLGCLISKL
jgi:hypothetical protein